MGRLGNQDWRSKFKVDLTDYIKEIQTAARSTNITFDQALKAAEINELRRRNDILIEDGDYRDEQMGGFGEILGTIASSIEEISSVYSRTHPVDEY